MVIQVEVSDETFRNASVYAKKCGMGLAKMLIREVENMAELAAGHEAVLGRLRDRLVGYLPDAKPDERADVERCILAVEFCAEAVRKQGL